MQADKLVEERAAYIETEISKLRAVTAINSTEEYNAIVETCNSLRLSSSDSFEADVKAKVSNYADFEAYDNAFMALCKNYEVTKTCGSCSGSGRFSCSSCDGAGKTLVTWYSEGDWGEKSYTSYTCTSCNGRGSSSCSTCSGTGSYTYLDFGD